MANAIVSTVRPNASDTPSRPMPTLGNAAAITALPQPPSTSQNVPKNSAARRLESGMVVPDSFRFLKTDAPCLARRARTIRRRSVSVYLSTARSNSHVARGEPVNRLHFAPAIDIEEGAER